MRSKLFLAILGILAVVASGFIPPVLAQPVLAQAAPSTVSATQAGTTLALGKLEVAMSQADPETKEFGMAANDYWKLIVANNDGPRVYNFFRALTAERKTPNATLLAQRASAACYYLAWLAQANLMEGFGQSQGSQIGEQAHADFETALKLDPENFSALYGYAIYEGYRPGGQAHQKELLARLDALRASRPYYPWHLVDTLEKTGKPE